MAVGERTGATADLRERSENDVFTLAAAFERQAARTPEAIAVCCEGDRASYADLSAGQRAGSAA